MITDAELTAVYREHKRQVFRYIYRRVHSVQIADDLTSEVFLGAWKLNFTPKNWGAFLTYSAYCRVSTYWTSRRAKRDCEFIDRLVTGRVEDPYAHAERQEDYDELYRALERLTEKQQRVIRLRYFGEMPQWQVAEALGIRKGMASKHCHAGLRQLQKHLSEIRNHA